MNQVDWSKAPEGATHWDSRGNACTIGFMKPGVRADEWEYFGISGDWILYGPIGRSLKESMIARPEALTWGGDGRPPAGVTCQYQHDQHCGVWYEGEILYISNEYTIVKGGVTGEQQYYTRNLSFRPIRTPEQIAAEEREQCIQDIASNIGRGTFYEDAERLYELGYRKQVTE